MQKCAYILASDAFATLFAILAAGSLLTVGVPARADTVYVTSGGSGTVGAYTPSGETLNASLITGLQGPNGIALDSDDHIFVVNGQGIGEYTTSGVALNPFLISGLDAPVGIALDGNGHLFVVNQSSLGNNGYIDVYTTSGSLLSSHLISGLFVPRDVALDNAGHIFVTTGAGLVAEYTTAGTLVNSDLIHLPGGVALDDNGQIYVANGYFDPVVDGFRGNVGKYTINGAVINPSLFSGFGAPGPIELALDGQGHIFVASGGAVGKYTTSGDVVNASMISDLGFQGAEAIAVGRTPNSAAPLPSSLGSGLGVVALLGIGHLWRRSQSLGTLR